MRCSAVILAALLIAACDSSPTVENSNGRPAGGSPQGNGAAIQRDGVIVAFGDSLTAGFGVETGNSYPDFLQKKLDERGYSYHVVNEGVSGDTTDSALVRTEIVASRNPDFVILAFGGNDGLRVLAVDRMKANLRRMIERLQKSGSQVILAGMKLPPNYGAEYRVPFERAFVDLAAEFDLPFLPFLLEGVGDVPSLMQPDGLHPTADGHQRIAINVMDVLEPLLIKARERAAVPAS